MSTVEDMNTFYTVVFDDSDTPYILEGEKIAGKDIVYYKGKNGQSMPSAFYRFMGRELYQNWHPNMFDAWVDFAVQNPTRDNIKTAMFNAQRLAQKGLQ
jgi:hypothetical protein